MTDQAEKPPPSSGDAARWRARSVARSFVRCFVAYGAAAAISILAAVPLLGLGRVDLRVPLDYRGDALLYASMVKSVVEHGWFWRNPSLGAPGGLTFYDYPNVAHESFHLLVLKAMSLFTSDWVLLTNVYFLLGFPLIALSSMAVFRRFGVGVGPAIVGAVLYAFLPSRLLKGETHLFLDCYYQVPLAVLALLWVCGDEPLFAGAGSRRRTVVAVLICLLGACTSSYYAFFTACLLAFGGAVASAERRSLRQVRAGILLAAVILVGMAANGLPSIVHHWRHGPNLEVANREPREAEVYGMKISQLLLPVDGHRSVALRWLKRRYEDTALLPADRATTLGVLGGAGFLVLLGAVFVRRREESPRRRLLSSLAVLNLGAVLLGTIGGFGSLFAFLVYPQIRAYSRIAVLIAFFSLFALVLLLDHWRRARPRAATLALPILLIYGLLDQAPPSAVRPYAPEQRAFNSDRAFVQRIEARLPAGAIVFGLPYVSFPEGQPVDRLVSYDLLRPWLHSSKLRWSFPTMRGRSADAFVRTLSGREPAQILDTLARVGFAGLLVQRDGYADRGAALESSLRGRLVGSEPLVSEDGRLAFFALDTDPRRPAAVAADPGEIDRTLYPLTLAIAGGFLPAEESPAGPLHWCGPRGEISIDNEGATTRQAAIRATLVAANSPASLSIAGDLLAATVRLDGAVAFSRTLTVPPGHHVIRLRCDGRPIEGPDDPRLRVWRFEGLAFEEIAAPGEPSR